VQAQGGSKRERTVLSRTAAGVRAIIGHVRRRGTGGEMFEKDEVLKELHNRLVAAGINPLDPKVQAISAVVNAFYAERTREVLQKMQDVLSKIET
jgi:hypothetical protein